MNGTEPGRKCQYTGNSHLLFQLTHSKTNLLWSISTITKPFIQQHLLEHPELNLTSRQYQTWQSVSVHSQRMIRRIMPLLSFADICRLASLPLRKPCSSVSPRPCAARRLSSSSKRLSSTSSASSSSCPVQGVLGVRGAMRMAFNPEVTTIGCRGCSISLLEELRNLGCFDFRLVDMQSLSWSCGRSRRAKLKFAGDKFDTAFHRVATLPCSNLITCARLADSSLASIHM